MMMDVGMEPLSMMRDVSVKTPSMMMKPVDHENHKVQRRFIKVAKKTRRTEKNRKILKEKRGKKEEESEIKVDCEL